MKTISFKVRKYEEPFSIDFDKIDLSVLNQITRIMDIENHQNPLVIEVEYELYMEIKELLCSEHWMIDFDHNEQRVIPIKLNGFKIIFKLNNNS